MPVIVRIVLTRDFQFIGYTDVAALLVLEHAVDPGNTCIRLPTCRSAPPIKRHAANKFKLGHTRRTILSALRR